MSLYQRRILVKVMDIEIIEKLLVVPGIEIKLKEWDQYYDRSINKEEAEDILNKNLMMQLSELQYKLFADKSQSLLIILQGMDTSGKDSTIRQVMSAFNPQSCKAIAFNEPSQEDLSHDYIWRVHKVVPAKGEIGIFNRSHYEDVLGVKVHELVSESTLSQRYLQINNFEKYLYENNIRIIKLFLYISKDEQKKRLEKRIEDPLKKWKLKESDIIERKYWNQYIHAYEDMLRNCSTKWAPWYIIPADKKWFRNYAIASIIVKELKEMDLKFPQPIIDLSKIIIDD
jgi:PPK2 family polyphosphate:nucleotide phosphotransferase